ncbi:MAG: 1-deoxy-D-xylulose-5-phosphate reductoisomerase, partial [Cellvibrionaceae bacterium]|nr:1-deoxy-D-xylulose-5-phosphate reductoisomerase [Cellvibrionaceae bacterium]
ALCAQRSWQAMAEQVLQHQPNYAVLADPEAAAELSQYLAGQGSDTEVLQGAEAMAQVAAAADTTMAAIVGAAGLLPTLAAVKAGKKVLLANKEALVMAGDLFMGAVKASGAQLLPIDSEHNAIFQCLPADYRSIESAAIRKILLTGSGGPFRQMPLAQLDTVTPAQACAHPNWSMGQKISVDSATMMNKGLEFIEARYLFAAEAEQIQVLLHPQSIIHSMVEYADGSVLAQLGQPDMRTPIAHALAWPERFEAGVESLDFTQLAELTFAEPDMQRFPCLALAIEASRRGGSAAATLNAANEVAVAAFLAEQIRFTDIAKVNAQVLAEAVWSEPGSIAAVIEIDAQARKLANRVIEQISPVQPG